MDTDIAAQWPDRWPPPGFVPVPSLVAGIEVYAPAPEQAHEQSRSFRCSQCGGTIQFDPGQQRLTCPFCGAAQDLDVQRVGRAAEQSEFTLEAMSRAPSGWGAARREIVCEACGAAVAVAPEALTTECAFCGSQRVLARDVAPERLRPMALIPFAVQPGEMRTRVAEWLSRGWMHPPELRHVRAVRDLVGIYLPYWTFSVRVRARWRAEVGIEHTERYRAGGQWHTRRVIRWYPRSGRVELSVEDHLVPGTERVSRVLLARLAPFDIGGLVEYHPGVLAGWQAKSYDLDLPGAWERAKVEIREQAKRACMADIGAHYVRSFEMTADFADERWRYVLLPVYLATYRFGERTYQVAMNGQTGRVAGQKPVAWARVWAAIAAALAPGVLVMLIGLLTLAAGGIGALGLLVGFMLFGAGLACAWIIFRKAQDAERI